MVDLSVLPAFIALILGFLAPPGPDMTYMLAVGLQGGRWAAVRAILGIGTGMAVYAAAVALGLGTLASAYPVALTVVKLGGAAYLLWLAYATFKHARDTVGQPGDVAAGDWYRRGLLVSLTNPKVILFFLAFLPKFLGHATSATAQLAMLGAVNVATEVLVYGAIGVGAGTFSSRFMRNPAAQRWLNHLAATVYLGLAVWILYDAAKPLLGR